MKGSKVVSLVIALAAAAAAGFAAGAACVASVVCKLSEDDPDDFGCCRGGQDCACRDESADFDDTGCDGCCGECGSCEDKE